MDPSRLLTHTLKASTAGESIARILAAALHAVEPAAAVRRALSGDGNHPGGDPVYNLDSYRHIWLVGAGKAGVPMASAAAEILGERLSGGVVVVKEGHTLVHMAEQMPRIQILEAAHPVPDRRGVQASAQMSTLLASAGPDDLVLCLLSGGGSALLVSPAPGISLADLQTLTSLLLASGAPIEEINALRKHLDTLKGGGLVRQAAPARTLALILSDVVGDRLDVIASGPTVPDTSTWDSALAVLERRGLLDRTPHPIQEHLRRGQAGLLPETPKPGDALFSNVHNLVVGSNWIAAQAAQKAARQEGFNTLLLTTFMQGEARSAGRVVASMARQIASSGDPVARPALLIAGGETTVTLLGSGLGGRNQELALAAALDLNGLENVLLVALATDGGDGPTPAAGAVVSGDTLARALRLGLDPYAYLANSDSYHFFAPLGDLLEPGPTLTNVNDLVMVAVL